MINLRTSPKNPEEFYEFFTYGLPLPPVKSHAVYVQIFKYIRENWITTGYQEKDNNYKLWFRYQESDPPRWYKVYEQFI